MGGMPKNVRKDVCSFSNLYRACHVCKRNVRWKDSVASFSNHSLVNTYKLKERLDNNTYNLSPYSVFVIKEPKTRKITSTRFKDRVFQRSLCDNYVTAEMTKDFIKDNYACQKDKGTDKAREALDRHLREYYKEHGTNGWVLKVDIHDYFGSTRHDVASRAVHKRVADEWACQEIDRVIYSFNQGEDPEKGIGLGSQVSQLIQLAVLDDLDHLLVDELKIQHYVRYMDDIILIAKTKDYLLKCLRRIVGYLCEIDLGLSEKKTHIQPITQPIHFLGFSLKLWETGKVTWKLLPENERDEKKKLIAIVERYKRGRMTKKDCDDCYQSWRAHASKGDSRGRILKMDKYYKSLWR